MEEHVDWARLFAESGLADADVHVDRAGGRVDIRDLGVVLDTVTHRFFLASRGCFRYALKLRQHCNARFRVDGAGVLLAKVGPSEIEIQTQQDLEILDEIYVGGCYSYAFARPVTVCDIGMNVGIASLYFASIPSVSRVVGYEPFRPTFEQMKRNVKRNPDLARKIEAHNFGLSDSRDTQVVGYSYRLKGSIGIRGTVQQISDEDVERREAIELRPVVDSLREALQDQNETHDVLVKIDCEGAEYRILRSLFESAELRRYRAFMIEWHGEGPDELAGYLIHAGFFTTFQYPAVKDLGMLYAVRTE